MRPVAMVLLCAMGCTGSFGLGLWFGTMQPRLDSTSRPGTSRTPQHESASAAVAAGPPGPRLVIPAIGVDAAIESVGLDSGNNMATPAAPQDVGWYQYGPPPGSQGDAVIDGHRDWTTGPAVFWKLDRLQPGDSIVVELPEQAPLHFQVVRLANVPYTAHPAGLFATSGPPRLSLKPEFDHSMRAITLPGHHSPASRDAGHRSWRRPVILALRV